jgi:hypothetical protein
VLAALMVASVACSASAEGWSVVPAAPAPNGSLFWVSCSSASNCTAVGWVADGTGGLAPLVERWGGTDWTIQSAPAPATPPSSYLLGVSCTSDASCVAVGNSDSGLSTAQTALTEVWNGTSWTLEPIEAPSGSTSTSLQSVSCVSPTDCTAVGEWVGPGIVVHPLAEHWNGSAWTESPMSDPMNGSTDNPLTAVSCAASNACAAIGYSVLPGESPSYSEIWDGSDWTVEEMPMPDLLFADVSCPTATECTAVAGQTETAAQGWDGSSWTARDPANPLDGSNSSFRGVSCPGPSVCIAVGTYSPDGGDLFVPLAESWVGGDWAVQPVPGDGRLSSVSCVTQSSCMAVGDGLSTYRYTGLPPAPVSISPPRIAGDSREGTTLQEVDDAWTGDPTAYAYQWQLCDSDGTHCTNLPDETSSAYTLHSYDVGHTFRVQEWATNAGGTVGPIDSDPTSAVLPLPPVSQSPPVISGTAVVRNTVITSNGTWSGSPTQFGYQWYDCDTSGGHCTAIGGATKQFLTLRAADVGHTIKVIETASNTGGTGGPVASAATDVVQPSPSAAVTPANAVPPQMRGVPVDGEVLAVSSGSWTGTTPLNYFYEWMRCTPGCVPIAGATANSYTLTAADIGAKIEAAVAARNLAGVGFAGTSELGPVLPAIAAIQAALATVLKPTGPKAKLAAVRRHHGYTFTFAAPGPGKLKLAWYRQAHTAHGVHHGRALVAAGSTTIAAAGSVELAVRLTKFGRHLLASVSRKLVLVADASYTPAGGSATTMTKKFSLKR